MRFGETGNNLGNLRTGRRRIRSDRYIEPHLLFLPCGVERRQIVEAFAETQAAELKKLGVTLTTLNKDQADYRGVDIAGPYKPDTYRY